MKVTVFLNQLGLGGTEKAAARWARGLRERGHEVHALALREGPRRSEFEKYDIEVRVISREAALIHDQLRSLQPDVIHAHAPGHPHEGDVLGEALSRLSRKIPVLQTNVFGQLDNPKENAWTDFRLFVSWTSCVQAARRQFRRLDAAFFQHASVAPYPLDSEEPPSRLAISDFRKQNGVGNDEALFGRLSRPEPNKWTDLPIKAFRLARKQNLGLKLLLREPPSAVAKELRNAGDKDQFIILPATSDPAELRLTMGSLDAVLHTSVIGESFGYGIAEPMNLAKPVIANSTPWLDQAQIELVRHGECGFIASTPRSIADAVLRLASDPALRNELGIAGQRHIRRLADPEESIERLERALSATLSGKPNPNAQEDLAAARAAAVYLDAHQFGHSWHEQLVLRPFHYRVRFYQLRRKLHLPTRKR